MSRAQEIARAYALESEVDFQISRMLYQSGFHSRAIFFAQQAAEKIIKACLALKEVFVSEHNLSSLLANIYRGEIPDLDHIVEAVAELERHGRRARFPLYHRPNLPIWVPSREYHQDEAMKCLANSEFTFNELRKFLQSRIQLS